MTDGERAAQALLASGKISQQQFHQLLKQDRKYHQLTPNTGSALVPFDSSALVDASGPRKKRRKFEEENTKENRLDPTDMGDDEKKEIYNRWGVSYEPPAKKKKQEAVKEAFASAATALVLIAPSVKMDGPSRCPLSPLVADPFIGRPKPKDAFHMMRETAATPNRFVKERVLSPPASVHKVDREVIKDFQSQLQDAQSEISYLRKETEKAKKGAQAQQRDWMDHLEVENTMDTMVSQLEIRALRDENEQLRTTALKCTQEKETANQRLRFTVSKFEEEKEDTKRRMKNALQQCEKDKSEANKRMRDTVRQCEAEKAEVHKARCETEKAEVHKARCEAEKADVHKARCEAEKTEVHKARCTPVRARTKRVTELGARFDQLQAKYAMTPKTQTTSAARSWSLKKPVTPTSMQKRLLDVAETGPAETMQALRTKFSNEIQALREEMFQQIDGGDRLKTLSDKLIVANDLAKTRGEELVAANKKVATLESEITQLYADLSAAKREAAENKLELADTNRKCTDFGEKLKRVMQELLESRTSLAEMGQRLQAEAVRHSAHEGAERSAQEAKRAEKLLKWKASFVAGLPVVKHGRKGKPRKRVVYLRRAGQSYHVGWGDGAQGAGKSEIGLTDVTSVLTGLSTAVLQRSGQQQKAAQYLSLVTPERSLDLECENEGQREQLHQVLDMLLKDEAGARFSKEVAMASRMAGAFDSVPLGGQRRQVPS
jgi:hypothetical protein